MFNFFKSFIIVDKSVDKKLNEWKVQKYSENRFLYKIPKERIIQQRKFLENDIYFILFNK